jgi:hypothetical protein
MQVQSISQFQTSQSRPVIGKRRSAPGKNCVTKVQEEFLFVEEMGLGSASRAPRCS